MTRDELALLLETSPVNETTEFAGDADDLRRAAGTAPTTPAAVLIALLDRPGGPSVLLTQRTAHLNDHAGQISFPGGRAEPGDPDATCTALREAEEEVGLARSLVDVLGCLPAYTTGSGFLVTPVVGWVVPPVTFTPDPYEVAEVFEVPFAFLMDSGNHRIETARFRGREYRYYAMPYRGRYIWGATAGMLVSMQRVLAAARDQSANLFPD
jgi:8-oxo-dGTP pyrophosphatase MutT (NUDIX family)